MGHEPDNLEETGDLVGDLETNDDDGGDDALAVRRPGDDDIQLA